MQHRDAEFGFEIGFVPSGNSSVTLPYTRDISDSKVLRHVDAATNKLKSRKIGANLSYI